MSKLDWGPLFRSIGNPGRFASLFLGIVIRLMLLF